MVAAGCSRDLHGDGIHDWPNDAGPDEQSSSVEPGSEWLWNEDGAECKAVT